VPAAATKSEKLVMALAAAGKFLSDKTGGVKVIQSQTEHVCDDVPSHLEWALALVDGVDVLTATHEKPETVNAFLSFMDGKNPRGSKQEVTK
jgi:hypothetical protein